MSGERKEYMAEAEPNIPPIVASTGNWTEPGRFTPATSLQKTDESAIQFECMHALVEMRIECDVSVAAYAFPKTRTMFDPVEVPAPLTEDTIAVSYDCAWEKLEDRTLPEIIASKFDREPLPAFERTEESEFQTLAGETDNPICNRLHELAKENPEPDTVMDTEPDRGKFDKKTEDMRAISNVKLRFPTDDDTRIEAVIDCSRKQPLENLHNNDESETQLERWQEVTLIRAPGDFEESIVKREPLRVKRELPEVGEFCWIADVTDTESKENERDKLDCCNRIDTNNPKFKEDPWGILAVTLESETHCRAENPVLEAIWNEPNLAREVPKKLVYEAPITVTENEAEVALNWIVKVDTAGPL